MLHLINKSMNETNTTYGDLREQYPNLTKEDLMLVIPADEKFTLGGISIDNVPVVVDPMERQVLEQINAQYDEPVPKAAMGGVEVNNIDTGWEVNVLGMTMNDRDDVYTVGIVVIIALLVYTAKVGIDHWFNKRLERYKKKLENE